MEKLLVVEDALAERKQLKSGLCGEYRILEGADRVAAMELFLGHSPKVVTLDLGLPPDPEGSSEGLLCLEWIIRMRPFTKVVVLTSGEREDAYRALERGAYDYYRKPVVLAELQVIIRRAFHLSSLEQRSCELKATLERTNAGIEGIAGQCVALKQLFSHRQGFPPKITGPVSEPVGPDQQLAIGLREETSAAAPLLEQTEPDEAGPLQVTGVTPPVQTLTLREARDRVEKWMVTDAIGNCRGNMTKASEVLGVSRPALYDLMKKYGICRRGIRG